MLALITVSLIWAFSFGLIKGQLTGIDPSLVSAIRLLCCCLVFAPFAFKDAFSRFMNKEKAKLFCLGIVQFGVMYWAYIYSYQYLPGYLVAVFTIFTPLYIFIFDSVWNKKFQLMQLMPITVSIIGSAIVVFKAPQSSAWLTGFFILQIANIAFAFGQVGYKYLSAKQTTSHATNMSIMYLGAAVFAGVIAATNVTTHDLVAISQSQWLALLYLGVIASGIGFYLWNLGVKQVKSEQLAIMNNGYIPLAVIFSATIFAEDINLSKLLLGGSMLLLSLWWAQRLSRTSPI